MAKTDMRQVRAAHVLAGMTWIGTLFALPGLAWVIDPEKPEIHARAIPPDSEDPDTYVIRAIKEWARLWETKTFAQVSDWEGDRAYIYTSMRVDGITVGIWGSVSIATARALHPDDTTPPASNGNGNGAGPSS